jgi:xanthine/uracil permease
MSEGVMKKVPALVNTFTYTVYSRVSGLMWLKGRPDNKKAG